MIMKKILLLLTAFMLFWGVSQAKSVSYEYILSEVSISKNGSVLNPNQPNGFEYTDSLIKVTWSVGVSKLNFTLKNITKSSIKLIWNDAVYVNEYGNISKVMHKGIKYIDRENDQKDNTIPAGANLDDLAQPIDNIYWYKGTNYGSGKVGAEWRAAPLFTINVKSKDFEDLRKSNIGAIIKIVLPIIVGEDDKYEYTFSFTVKDVLLN